MSAGARAACAALGPSLGLSLALSLGLSLALASAAGAYVSEPERIHDAIADTNEASGRDEAIRLSLSMQIGERQAVATGELVSHPSGLARLELRGSGGLLERHLLQGSELTVARNGVPLDDPRTFLPPFFVLQADSGMLLRAALTSFAVDPELVGLAACGDADCLLIGDPRRAIPRPAPPPVRGVEAWAAARGVALEDVDAMGGAAGPPAAPSAAGRDAWGVDAGPPGVDAPGSPRVWVETGSYEVRGFDDGRGVKIRLGPVVSFDSLRVPSWISVEEPGRVPARFEVTGASLVTAPASAFTRDWLFSADSGADAPAGGSGAPTSSD